MTNNNYTDGFNRAIASAIVIVSKSTDITEALKSLETLQQTFNEMK